MTVPSSGVVEAADTRTRNLILVATILASTLAFVDGTIVTIALPTIQRTLGAGFDELQWVVNAYALTLGALILVGGGLGDRIGRRTIFLAGIALFTAASLLCAMAPNPLTLILARGIQGIGAALLIPQSLAIITATFPREVRGAAIGTWAAASAVTTSLGPPIGGFLIDTIGWRVAFWVNLPLAIIAFWLTLRVVPETRGPETKSGIDWTGTLTAIAAFGALTFGLTALPEGGIENGFAWAAILVGLAGIGLFVWIEARAGDPVMPLNLFRSRIFTGANIYTVFQYGCLGGVIFLLPFELIGRRGLSATETAFSLIPIGIGIALFSRYAGRLADQMGPRPFMAGGAAAVAVACAILALMPENFWLGIGLPMVIFALGMAALVSPLTTAVMNAAPKDRSGAASGVNNAAARIAGLLAVAILGAVTSFVFMAQAGEGARFGVLPEPGDPARPVLEAAFSAAFSSAMWVAAAWAALAALSAWVFIEKGNREEAS